VPEDITTIGGAVLIAVILAACFKLVRKAI
jgi:hypothetical protein